jgi:ABC-type bacteriocin/lantibiotic exporter with double-glycine peptidase domain
LHIFIFILPLLISCAGAPDVRESRAHHILENVPFYPQEAYQCGPASLAGVLNYWRVAVSPEDIASEIYSESAKGTLDVDMVLYAERKGLKVRQYGGNIEEIKRNIDLGHPVIVLVDYGFWVYQQNHFMVVVGYNEKGILANSGKERLKFISFKRFLKSWKRTEFWTMLILHEH